MHSDGSSAYVIAFHPRFLAKNTRVCMPEKMLIYLPVLYLHRVYVVFLKNFIFFRVFLASCIHGSNGVINLLKVLSEMYTEKKPTNDSRYTETLPGKKKFPSRNTRTRDRRQCVTSKCYGHVVIIFCVFE